MLCTIIYSLKYIYYCKEQNINNASNRHIIKCTMLTLEIQPVALTGLA